LPIAAYGLFIYGAVLFRGVMVSAEHNHYQVNLAGDL
jgi:hypothetical protein